MRSDEFKKLLATDASTIEGQDFIARYYGINNWVQLEEKGGKDGLIQDHGINNWAQLEEKGEKDGLIQDQAGSYIYLLKSVKAKDNKGNVWISFYEGYITMQDKTDQFQ